MLLWGLGENYIFHWFGLVFAQGHLAVSSTLSLSTSIQYATSSYRDFRGEFIMTISLIRITMSFAVNHGVAQWINDIGQRNTSILIAVLALIYNGRMFAAGG
jgi:hypothetical protein